MIQSLLAKIALWGILILLATVGVYYLGVWSSPNLYHFPSHPEGTGFGVIYWVIGAWTIFFVGLSLAALLVAIGIGIVAYYFVTQRAR